MFANTVTINIIGAGRLGRHWIAALSMLEQVRIQQVVSQHHEADGESYSVINSLNVLKPAALTILCVPDNQLSKTIDSLAHVYQHDTAISQRFIHCAGRFASDLLTPLANLGALVAAIHPTQAFTLNINQQAFHKCPISMEGDTALIEWLTPLLAQLGASPFMINPQTKILYHSACTLASNGLIGLAQAVEQIFLQCGLPASQAHQVCFALMTSSMQNCHQHSSLDTALTGPIKRADTKTVAAHLQALAHSPLTADLYKQLSEHLLSVLNQETDLTTWIQQDSMLE